MCRVRALVRIDLHDVPASILAAKQELVQVLPYYRCLALRWLQGLADSLQAFSAHPPTT